MQRDDSFRPLGWEDYVDIWRRRGELFMAVTVLTLSTALVAVALWPDVYRSEALILFDRPKVAPRYLPTVVEANLEMEIQGLIQETLSRTRLEKLIRDLQIYPLPEGGVPDRVIADLRRQIQIEILRDSPGGWRSEPYGFRVAFLDRTPQRAHQVTQELVSFFVEGNERLQSEGLRETLHVLDEQVQAATQELAEKERQLQEFKMSHSGQLPAQERLLVETLMRLQGRLHSSEQAEERAGRDQSAFRAVLLGKRLPDDDLFDSDAPATPRQLQLQTLRARLAELESRYTADHPDVVKTREEIAALDRQRFPRRAIEGAGADGEKSPDRTANPLVADRLQSYQDEIRLREQEQSRLLRQIARFEADLRAMPLRASQLAALEREYETAREKLEQVLDRQRQAQLAGGAAAGMQGHQFRVLDAPSLPVRPYKPDRLRLNLAAIVGSFILGVLAVGGLEFRDHSFKSEKDVEFYLGLRTLATVPDCLTPPERNRARLRRLGLAAVHGGVLLGSVVIVTLVYVLK